MSIAVTTRDAQLKRLGEQFSAVAKGMHARYGSEMVCTTPVHDKVLLIVGSEKQVNIKRLSEMLLVTSGAATQHVTALEESGLISRTPGAQDRRESSVQLTEAGQETFGRIRARYMQGLRELFAELDDTELETFLELLSKASHKYSPKGAKA